MKNVARIVLALVVILAGATLVPAMGLPDQGFNWQLYAGVYSPTTLQANHPDGKPGSFFTFSGVNFTPNSIVTIYANNTVLGTVQASSLGELLFLLNTTGADQGYYQIKAIGSESATSVILLLPDRIQWPQEDNGTVFSLPPNTAAQVLFMPLVNKMFIR